MTDIDLVVNLKLREDILVEKCLGRRICSQCGGNFNIANISIKGENGRPDISMAPLLPPAHCASKLITRADDTEQVVKERLRIYHELVCSTFSFCFVKFFIILQNPFKFTLTEYSIFLSTLSRHLLPTYFPDSEGFVIAMVLNSHVSTHVFVHL